METVTISPKFQVVIPQSIRKALNLRPGQKVVVNQRDGRIEFVPVKPAGELKGVLKGLDVHFEREDDRI